MTFDEFINNNTFYYDTFSEEIILSKDREKEEDGFIPPERYFQCGVCPVDGDTYKDTYWVDREKGLVIDFAYAYEDSWNVNPNWNEVLFNYLESHGLPRKYYGVKCRLYPRKRFKRLLRKYFFDLGKYEKKYKFKWNEN